MSNHDKLYRYLFKNYSVRGELVSVNDTWQQILHNHDYPSPVKKLLGEMLVATSLLTATLKFSGEITVQLQGDGALTLAIINGNHQQQMRGLARFNGDIADGSTLKGMVGNGSLVITIAPTIGKRYQGIVALDGKTLTECLENYFRQSEQLATRLFIFTDQVNNQDTAAGILLQTLPDQQNNSDEFEHLIQVTATIKAQELFTLPAEEVLYRLYHQEDVILYEPQKVSYHCTCSRERCARVLATLPTEEIDEMLFADNKIDMHCEYCGNHYLFDAIDIAVQQKNKHNPTIGQIH